MSWDGYFTLDSAEFANVARFEKYAEAMSWFSPAYGKAELAEVLQETYTDPATDLAPWYDDDVPESANFFGFYPLDVSGIESSTRTASSVESTNEGGIPGRIRHASKEIVFSGLIAGSTEAAVEYGMGWLRRTLLGAVCSPFDARDQALGADLRFMGHTPHLDPDRAPQAILDSLTRRFRRVVVTNGPQETAHKRMSCGSYMWMVQFTATAGDPFEYGERYSLVSNLFEEDGEVWGTEATPGTVESTGTYNEESCSEPSWTPIYDPDCAVVITPPTPPNVPFGCWTPPAEGHAWDRYLITIPEQNFPTWGELLPLISITSATVRRDVRLRLYRDPGENLDPDADPCSFFSDMVISYMPAGTMLIDASFEDVHVTTVGGSTRRADALVFATTMRPITWPVLECGVQHLLTVDVEDDGDMPVIDIDLIPRKV